MPTQPAPKPQPKPEPPKPSTPKPEPAKPAAATPEAGKAPAEPGLPIGAKPKQATDPQAKKFEPNPGPPSWDAPPKPAQAKEEWTPEPDIDPLAQTPPENTYADGMPVAVEQRARAAYVEEHGLADYVEETDEREDDDKPGEFKKDALAGGGAFVAKPGAKGKQVPGVAPPAKRS